MKFWIASLLMLAGERITGPLAFRFIVQPLTACVLAFRDGRNDARNGQPPYLSTLLTDRTQRYDLLLHGWKSIARVFVVAIIVDFIYQGIVYRWVYPLPALVIAILLAIVPYLLVRGPANRLLRRFGKPQETRAERKDEVV